MKDLFVKMQIAFDGLWQNMFSGFGNLFAVPIAFYCKINSFLCPSKDNLENLIVKKAMKSGEFRDNLTKGIYVPKDPNQALGRLENAFMLFEKSQIVEQKIRKAVRAGILPKKKNIAKLLDEALEKDIINDTDILTIKKSLNATYDAIKVDEYDLEEYKNI
jgi:acyl-CoA dehydrogenase